MFKKLFWTAFMAVGVLSAMAQGKAKVYCEYFSYKTNIGAARAEQVRSAVMAGINETNRVELIDVASVPALQLEASRRSEESAIGDETARNETMRTAGATHILQGFVSQVSVKESTTEGETPTTFYAATVTYTLKMVDVSTGKLMFSKDFNLASSALTFSSGDTPDEAVANALKGARKQMRILMDEQFKLKAEVVEEDFVVKKGEIISCYVTLGSDAGIQKGQQMDVSVVKIIAGKEMLKQIGTLKVEEVVADELCHCKVTKGGELMKEAMDEFLKNPESVRRMQVTTKAKGPGVWGKIGDAVKQL